MIAVEIEVLNSEGQEAFLERTGAPFDAINEDADGAWYKTYDGKKYALVVVDDAVYNGMHRAVCVPKLPRANIYMRDTLGGLALGTDQTLFFKFIASACIEAILDPGKKATGSD